jgi:tripartite-type tricarboxylate transporter receptor subunit TctC
MSKKNIFRILFVGLCLVFMSHSLTLADDYPSKPITLIIPFGPGGSHDINARVFSSIIHQYLGQPIMVKLMPGAGGQLGTAAAVKAKPDGYTLLFGHNYIDQLQPLIEKLPYNPSEDLVTVCRLNYSSGIILVQKDKPWKTLQEVIDAAKKNPGKITVAHTGKWGAAFINMALVFTQSDAPVQFVGYKGGGPAFQAALAGEVDVGSSARVVGISHVKKGTVRALAVIDEKRDPELPDVPSLGEMGFSVSHMNRIIMAPSGIPKERLEILRAAFGKLMKDKTFKRMMGKLGENMEYLDGPDYEKLRPVQREEYSALVKKITGQ